MFVFNEDLSVYCTRGDYCNFPVTGEFKPGDVVRFKAFRKKDCATVVMQRDFTVDEASDTFAISLTGEDTKIGEVISKPVDYWYEVELNPDTNPQTIVGYDEAGAKVFKLFPEGKDVDAEDIEVVGKKTLQELVDYALAEAKASGDFNGEDGKDGYTPQKGIDYFTEEDKEEVAQAVAQEFTPLCANAIKGNISGAAVTVDDVSPIAHNANVRVRGKNLFPFPYPVGTSTGGGVTYTAQADGGIQATGTATGQHNFTLYFGKLPVHEVVTFSLSGDYTNLVGVMVIRNKAGENLFNKNVDNAITVDLSAYPADAVAEVLIKRKSNVAVSGTVYPQLELGNTATAYESYVDPTTVKITRYGKDEADNPQTFTPSADGTCEIPALSPTMTLKSDTSGVIVECEYSQDIKKYIDSKMSGILTATVE